MSPAVADPEAKPRSRLRRLVNKLKASPVTNRSQQPSRFEGSPLTQSPHSSPTWADIHTIDLHSRRFPHSPISSPTTAATWQHNAPYVSSPHSLVTGTLFKGRSTRGDIHPTIGEEPSAVSPIHRAPKLSREALVRKLFTAFQSGDREFALQDVAAWLDARDAAKAASRRDAIARPQPPRPSRVQMVKPSPAEFLQWQQERVSIDSDEETESELDRCGREMTRSLWAALEKSRRVVEEEKLKFELLLAKQDPDEKQRLNKLRPEKVLASVREAERESCSSSAHAEQDSCSSPSPPLESRQKRHGLRDQCTVERDSRFYIYAAPEPPLRRSSPPVSLSRAKWLDLSSPSDSTRHLRRLLRLHRHQPIAPRRNKPIAISSYPLAKSSSCPPATLESPERRSTDNKSPDLRDGGIQTTPPRPALKLDLPPRGSEIDFTGFGYKHVDFLAEGSLGQLHLVERIGSGDGRLWVAKAVDLSAFSDPVEASQALLEAELLRRLRHPNIVEYLSSFVTDSSLVIIMEYCELGDLHSYLDRLRSEDAFVSEALVVRWIEDIATGLDHMHRQSILHCDVKSSNIFLDKHMTAKIGDLGIARELRRGALSLSPVRCPRGTPVYMSPEMCSKAALTERTDCWSLGCIVFEMCHLRHAFPSQLVLGRRKRRRRRRVSEKHSSASSGSLDSHSTSTSAAFLPGITARSNMSVMCREMLLNLKSDLRKLKTNSAPVSAPPTAASALPFWGSSGDAASTFYLPQILPNRYSALLNYLVCAMLEPKPADRPSLRQIIQILRERRDATEGETSPSLK
eukprot:Gregarina_sp_Poly_1__4335@NODE_234_length_11010_cov_523_298456_g207_i0_p2_GENE_NODE_234_length_11010_cov_523_298456_g207_i0NODE_234_length_11010_cov_523_298456_g207_i0_p2_ORF_typecomplete_len799_score142_89Pkinase/PF00069_25/1_1e54Pkinase_Tyr/PF07714_17/3_5e40Pkinase_Tyr/PF07714_17/1_2e02Kinaselike/PF14531_6/2e10Kdo/PF06293_14/2_7e07Pkinase_fungal/PF17667_1/2_1e07APH/PF01636_23/1_3e03APH/PF01636_23/0_037RIO1/PF01163_22/0_075WaaY/PF06176_11/0_2_NODE_234_length_11010_cov_523_298456_g207_i034015797